MADPRAAQQAEPSSAGVSALEGHSDAVRNIPAAAAQAAALDAVGRPGTAAG